MISEPEIVVRSREELLYLLSEAAEIEHNLMCCYLFAAFGMKTGADGLDAADSAEVHGWKRAIVSVAIEEMTHLALVSNLMSAIGGAPHFGRPNFPVAAGYHPSGVVVQLRRFDKETLDHFIYLERPEGVDLPDAGPFASQARLDYHRLPASRLLMPSAQDYLTVGYLYRSLEAGLRHLTEKLGENVLFSGDPALQVGPELVSLPGLIAVADLASALQALDTIVEQGEGSPEDSAHSHYRRFIAIREAFEKRVAADPHFDPSRNVAPSPVMRRPPDPQGKTFVDHLQSASVMELANAIYGSMLRCLAQGFADTDAARKKAFLDAAIDSMFALIPVAEHLTTLPAQVADTGLAAGMSFAMLRDLAALPVSSPAERIFAERLNELGDGARLILGATDLAEAVSGTLRDIAGRLEGLAARN